MRRALEFGAFALLALGAHVAALTYAPPPDTGAMARGAQGTGEITLRAVAGRDAATVAAAVADWMRPPEASQTAPETPPQPRPDSPDAADSPPDPRTTPDAPPPRADRPALAQQITRPAPLPRADTQSYTPPPKPEPKPRPKPRPASKPKPKTKSKPAAQPQASTRKAQPNAAPAARQGQRAAGAGGGQKSGTNGKSRNAGLSAGAEKKLIAKWGGQVRARILRNKRFPAGARGAGTVRLRIVVARGGTLVSAQVARSSGNPAFDRAALAAVRAARRFPAAPRGLNKQTYTFTLNMRFG